MTTRRKLVYATLAVVIAFSAHALWKTLFNPLVWHITYIGVHIARAIHEPNYDSVTSARIFDALAIVFNALIYFAVLLALDRLLVGLRSQRS
ncbi:MAG TPA: hypothetical protein VI488_16140 [Candidatus Angelobacter sp.]